MLRAIRATKLLLDRSSVLARLPDPATCPVSTAAAQPAECLGTL
jgi:hypothetical protein